MMFAFGWIFISILAKQLNNFPGFLQASVNVTRRSCYAVGHRHWSRCQIQSDLISHSAAVSFILMNEHVGMLEWIQNDWLEKCRSEPGLEPGKRNPPDCFFFFLNHSVRQLSERHWFMCLLPQQCKRLHHSKHWFRAVINVIRASCTEVWTFRRPLSDITHGFLIMFSVYFSLVYYHLSC